MRPGSKDSSLRFLAAPTCGEFGLRPHAGSLAHSVSISVSISVTSQCDQRPREKLQTRLVSLEEVTRGFWSQPLSATRVNASYIQEHAWGTKRCPQPRAIHERAARLSGSRRCPEYAAALLFRATIVIVFPVEVFGFVRA